MTKEGRDQIDIEIMHTIFGNNPTAIARYILNFVEATSEMLYDAVKVIKENNTNRAMECLHRIKGPVGSCGFTRLYKLCEQVEDDITRNHWAAAIECCHEIENQLNKLQAEVERKFSDCL